MNLVRALIGIVVIFSIPLNGNCQNWASVGGGVNLHVRAFYADTINNTLYLAGRFKFANGNQVNGIANWNGESFTPLGTGADDCINFTCIGFLSVMQYNNEIYCSYLGYGVGGVPVYSIARWDGIAWDSVGGGVRDVNGNGAVIWEQMVHENELYIMGRFHYGGDVVSSAIVKWNGQEYLPMNFPYVQPLSDYSPQILGAVIFENELYVGGQFASGHTIADQVDIARFDGQSWHPVGGGIKGAIGDINDLFVYKDELYICGNFRKSNGNAGNGIMKLKDGEWVDVGGSFDEETVVAHQMLEYHGDMYVFGTFNSVGGGIQVSNIAKWDGENWCGFPNQFDQRIERAIVFKDSIFIGGWFNYIDGDSLPYLAKWSGYVDDNCEMVAVSKIPQKEQEKIVLSPNPSAGHVVLTLPKSEGPVVVRLCDTAGAIVYQSNAVIGPDGNLPLDLSSLSPGLYFVQVIGPEKLHTAKIILH